MTTRLKSQTLLQLRSKLSFGIHKGLTVAYIIDHDHKYLFHALKRGQIKLSARTIVILNQKNKGLIKHKLSVDKHDTMSYHLFNEEKESNDENIKN